jgi:hypothetical protein
VAEDSAVLLVGILCLLPFAGLAILAQDRLTRRLCESFPEAWDQAGRPVGWFWRPSDALHCSVQAFLKATLVWPFRSPPVLAGDQASKRDQRLMRLGLVVWNLGVLGKCAYALTRHGFSSGS